METGHTPMFGSEPWLIIVDNDHSYLNLVSGIYADLKLAQRIKTFSSGESLLDFLQAINDTVDYPSLIVLDDTVCMLNGETVLSAIKNNTRFNPIPVAIYSSALYADIEKEWLLAGAIYCRQKITGKERIKQMLIEFLSLADLYHDSFPMYRNR